MDGKQVTMKDVAMAMGVSIVTVSKALADKEGVSEDLRAKIIEKARELGYVAKSEKKKDAAHINIGIIISDRFIGDDSFYVMIYQKMIRELTARRYIGITEVVRIEDEENGILPNIVRTNSVSQVIVVGEMKSIFLENLVKTGVGIIFFDFENEEFDVDCVVNDGVKGGFLLTRYLVKNGHERIGFVGNYKSTRSILDRYMGYLKYLIAKDQIINKDWVVSDREESGELIDLTLPKDIPDAFVCNCDVVACRLIEALEQVGYSVPRDVSVVGYDDFAGQAQEPLGLTTYSVDTDMMIQHCMHIVEKRTENPEYRRGITVVYGTIVERDTVRVREV